MAVYFVNGAFVFMKKFGLDILFVLGMALAAVGLWLIYPPAAFVVVGVVLMGLSLLAAGRGSG